MMPLTPPIAAAAVVKRLLEATPTVAEPEAAACDNTTPPGWIVQGICTKNSRSKREVAGWTADR